MGPGFGDDLGKMFTTLYILAMIGLVVVFLGVPTGLIALGFYFYRHLSWH